MPTKWSGRPGETLDVLVQTMGIDGQHTGGRIIWEAGTQTDELPAPGGNIRFLLDQPGIVTLHAKWLADDGEQLATNQVDLVCVSSEPASVWLRVLGDPALVNVLHDLGYHIDEGDLISAAVDEIVVACHYTGALEAHVQSGGRVLLLADPIVADELDPGVALPMGCIALRAGSAWQGDWANSLAWVKKQGPLSNLPGGPLLEMEWADLMPDAVLAGLPSWVQRHHSWAGLVVGWIHKPVSLLTLMPYGRGLMLITTFKLNPVTLATDAIAQALFAGMLNLF